MDVFWMISSIFYRLLIYVLVYWSFCLLIFWLFFESFPFFIYHLLLNQLVNSLIKYVLFWTLVAFVFCWFMFGSFVCQFFVFVYFVVCLSDLYNDWVLSWHICLYVLNLFLHLFMYSGFFHSMVFTLFLPQVPQGQSKQRGMICCNATWRKPCLGWFWDRPVWKFF